MYFSFKISIVSRVVWEPVTQLGQFDARPMNSFWMWLATKRHCFFWASVKLFGIHRGHSFHTAKILRYCKIFSVTYRILEINDVGPRGDRTEEANVLNYGLFRNNLLPGDPKHNNTNVFKDKLRLYLSDLGVRACVERRPRIGSHASMASSYSSGAIPT